jgi:hypothetical protein
MYNLRACKLIKSYTLGGGVRLCIKTYHDPPSGILASRPRPCWKYEA